MSNEAQHSPRTSLVNWLSVQVADEVYTQLAGFSGGPLTPNALAQSEGRVVTILTRRSWPGATRGSTGCSVERSDAERYDGVLCGRANPRSWPDDFPREGHEQARLVRCRNSRRGIRDRPATT